MADLFAALTAHNLKECILWKEPNSNIQMDNLEEFLRRLKIRLEDTDRKLDTFSALYQVIREPGDLMDYFITSFLVSASNAMEHPYSMDQPSNSVSYKSLMVNALLRLHELIQQPAAEFEEEEFDSIDSTKEMNDLELAVANNIAGWTLMRARRILGVKYHTYFDTLCETVHSGHTSAGTKKYRVKVGASYLAFFVSLTRTVFAMLTLQNLKANHTTLIGKVEGSIASNQDLRKAFMAMFPTSESPHVLPILKAVTKLLLKSATKRFLESNNLIPNKQSFALRTTISCTARGKHRVVDSDEEVQEDTPIIAYRKSKKKKKLPHTLSAHTPQSLVNHVVPSTTNEDQPSQPIPHLSRTNTVTTAVVQ